MKVLVAGGAGLIGGTMCRRLLERGTEVVCVDNLVTGFAGNVEALLDRPGFWFVEADITEGLELAGPFDAVVNLASPASAADFTALGVEILAAGSGGVANLLDLAVRDGARFVQASTNEVYGDPLVHPQPETYWGNVNPLGPRSVLAEAKRFAEALCFAYSRRHGLSVGVARIFDTYGPGVRPDDRRLVPTFITQALSGLPMTVHGSGRQTRSFCFVDDQVGGLLALLGSDYSGPVNIGSEEEHTVLEVAELVQVLAGSTSAVVFDARLPDDPARSRPDLTVARTVLGWWPQTALPAGVGRTIDWFRAQLAHARP